MVGKKVKALLSLKDKKQIDTLGALGVSSKQALSTKFSLNRFTVRDLIKICGLLDCELIVKDKSTGKDLISFDIDDV